MHLVIHVETSDKQHIIHVCGSEPQARDYVEETSSLYYNKGKTYRIAKVVATNEPKREWT